MSIESGCVLVYRVRTGLKVLEHTGLSLKVLKIKLDLKSTGKTIKGIEKSLNFTIYRSIQHYLWRPKSV